MKLGQLGVNNRARVDRRCGFPNCTLLGKSRPCGMETRTYEMYFYLC